MLRKTQSNLFLQGHFSGVRFTLMQMFTPGMFKDYLAINNAHKVERGLRVQTGIKANKIDIRTLLALPVTDSAHPYCMEYPWEKLVWARGQSAATMYQKWYVNKIMMLYAICLQHKLGCLEDDYINLRGWFNRAARTRSPQQLIIHADRRVNRSRVMRFQWNFLPKDKWVRPCDNVSWYRPYIIMVVDEWEEKWGFFAGQTVEY